MTWKEAAILILKDRGKPLHTRAIVDEIFSRKLKSTNGYTPVLTLRTEMYRACVGHEHISDHSGKLIFYEEEDGKFGLYNWIKDASSSMNHIANKLDNTSVVKGSILNVQFQEEDDELGFIEGKKKYLLHKKKERNAELIKQVKSQMYLKNRDLPCFVCGFSFLNKYEKYGEKFIEAHHLTPISELTTETRTKPEDIALVCSNCHKMIHRIRPWLSIEKLKDILNK